MKIGLELKLNTEEVKQHRKAGNETGDGYFSMSELIVEDQEVDIFLRLFERVANR